MAYDNLNPSLVPSLHSIDIQWLTNSRAAQRISMVDSAKVLCPLFDEIERFWYRVKAPACSYFWTTREILIRYRNEEKWLYWSSLSSLSGCAEALCPHKCSKSGRWLMPMPSLTSSMRMWRRTFIATNFMKGLFCWHHSNHRGFVNTGWLIKTLHILQWCCTTEQ